MTQRGDEGMQHGRGRDTYPQGETRGNPAQYGHWSERDGMQGGRDSESFVGREGGARGRNPGMQGGRANPGGQGQSGRGYGREAQRQDLEYDHWSGHNDSQEQFDPDYLQWRSEQIRNLDNDYKSWKQDRYKKFSDEFNQWRSRRNSGLGGGGGAAGSSVTDAAALAASEGQPLQQQPSGIPDQPGSGQVNGKHS